MTAWHPPGCGCGLCGHSTAVLPAPIRRRFSVRVPPRAVLLGVFVLGAAVGVLLHFTLLAPGYVCHGDSNGGFTCARN